MMKYSRLTQNRRVSGKSTRQNFHTAYPMFSRFASSGFVGLLLCLLCQCAVAQHHSRRMHKPVLLLLEARKACNPAQITVAKPVLCLGESLDLQSNVLPSYTFRWLRNNVVLAGKTDPVLTIISPGTYKLEVTNTAIPGCVRLDSVTIRESTLSRVTISPATGSTVACAGNALTTSVIGGGSVPLVYQWRYNYRDIPGNTPSLAAPGAGLYTVSVFDANCSVDADVVEVFEKPTPIFPASSVQCANGSKPFPLYAEPKDGLFAGPGIKDNLFSASLAGGGTHTLTYSVTNAAGCSAAASQTITVIDIPQPDLGPNQTITVGTQLTLQGPVRPESRSLTYAWEPLTEGLRGASVQVHPQQTTTYRLTVSEGGRCPLSSSVQIDVLPGLFIPTAFTPNADGQNDTWSFVGIEAFPNCRVRIFDRWGSLLLDEWPYRQPWDGRIRGERVAAGPYRFVVNPTPTLPERSGTLVLVE